MCALRLNSRFLKQIAKFKARRIFLRAVRSNCFVWQFFNRKSYVKPSEIFFSLNFVIYVRRNRHSLRSERIAIRCFVRSIERDGKWYPLKDIISVNPDGTRRVRNRFVQVDLNSTLNVGNWFDEEKKTSFDPCGRFENDSGFYRTRSVNNVILFADPFRGRPRPPQYHGRPSD